MKASTAKKIADKKNSEVIYFKNIKKVFTHIKKESSSGFCNTFGIIHNSLEKKYSKSLKKKGYRVFLNKKMGQFIEIEIEWFL